MCIHWPTLPNQLSSSLVLQWVLSTSSHLSSPSISLPTHLSPPISLTYFPNLSSPLHSRPLLLFTSSLPVDVQEVNGVAVDWLSQHVYWTDAVRGTVELCDYDGDNRRVVVSGLGNPRAIVISPREG